jgi:hypothetical protein
VLYFLLMITYVGRGKSAYLVALPREGELDATGSRALARRDTAIEAHSCMLMSCAALEWYAALWFAPQNACAASPVRRSFASFMVALVCTACVRAFGTRSLDVHCSTVHCAG